MKTYCRKHKQMKGIYLFFIYMLSFYSLAAFSQQATIREETVTMKTYMFSDPDPVPAPGRIYPWFRFDGFTNKGVPKQWKMVIMENPYIKVWVCPDIGGKVWGAIEKSTGKTFLYFNHAVKFRDIAMRGPWTSGGLEFNFGAIGHVPTGATPIDYVIKKHPDGSVSCTVGAIDLPSRTKWNVEIRLEGDKAYFETHTTWVNMSELPNAYYHWMNAAAKTAGNLHFIYPGDHYIGHGGEVGSWPVENGRDLSWYKNNNFGGAKSYHVINAYANFFGGYWVDENFGFGHMATYDDKPGKKLWIWGLSRQGMIWEDLLTDTDGQYIEFQAGKLFNQAAYSSTYSPFKHKEFPAGDADVMTERWFPLAGTGGMVAASEYAVINVEKRDNGLVAKISALQPLDDTLTIKSGGKIIKRQPVHLQTLQMDSVAFGMPENGQYSVLLEKAKLIYNSKPSARIVDRPVNPNPDFDWNTAYGWYIRGYEAEKQRRYGEAWEDYEKSLEKEKAFAPALDRKALLLYRKMKYEEARAIARQSLAVDTYDPLANYVFGLSCERLGETANARSGFSITAASVDWRVPAYIALAASYLRGGDERKALHYAKKALDYNAFNIPAYEMEAVIYRKKGEKDKAAGVLKKLEQLDPTLQFIAAEKWFWGDITEKDLRASFRNELPVQYFLELALTYHRYGADGDAVKVLTLAPQDPVVLLWLARLDQSRHRYYLQQALEMPVTMVFPYRRETAELLERCSRAVDHWKLKYYLALIYWNKGRTDEAKDLFTQCGDRPSNPVFWLAKAKLFRDDSVRLAAIRRARALAPGDWRAALAAIRYALAHGQAAEVLSTARAFTLKYPENPGLGLAYARALNQTQQYRKSIVFLEKFRVLPYEGSADGRILYHQACLNAALSEMNKGKYSRAVSYLEKARKWPENLGAGRPYDVDERMEDYLTALALEKAGKKKEAEKWYRKAAEYQRPDRSQENSKLIFQLLALKKLNRSDEADHLFTKAESEFPENMYIKWAEAVYRQDPDARTLEKEITTRRRAQQNPYDTAFRDAGFEEVLNVLRQLQRI